MSDIYRKIGLAFVEGNLIVAATKEEEQLLSSHNCFTKVGTIRVEDAGVLGVYQLKRTELDNPDWDYAIQQLGKVQEPFVNPFSTTPYKSPFGDEYPQKWNVTASPYEAKWTNGTTQPNTSVNYRGSSESWIGNHFNNF